MATQLDDVFFPTSPSFIMFHWSESDFTSDGYLGKLEAWSCFVPTRLHAGVAIGTNAQSHKCTFQSPVPVVPLSSNLQIEEWENKYCKFVLRLSSRLTQYSFIIIIIIFGRCFRITLDIAVLNLHNPVCSEKTPKSLSAPPSLLKFS